MEDKKVFTKELEKIVGNSNPAFIESQWRLLKSGVMDVRIHDAAFHAWVQAGGTIK